jgi:hypothetical protein
MRGEHAGSTANAQAHRISVRQSRQSDGMATVLGRHGPFVSIERIYSAANGRSACPISMILCMMRPIMDRKASNSGRGRCALRPCKAIGQSRSVWHAVAEKAPIVALVTKAPAKGVLRATRRPSAGKRRLDPYRQSRSSAEAREPVAQNDLRPVALSQVRNHPLLRAAWNANSSKTTLAKLSALARSASPEECCDRAPNGRRCAAARRADPTCRA